MVIVVMEVVAYCHWQLVVMVVMDGDGVITSYWYCFDHYY